MRYILDACALLAAFKREPGWKKIYSLIIWAKAGDFPLYMHMVNLLEVYYSIWRDEGPDIAQEVLDFVDGSAIQIITDMSIPFFQEAGRLKATYRISLADTFVCAASSLLYATVVTADGEMEPIEGINFFYFRPPKEKQDKEKIDLNAVIRRTDQEHAARVEAEHALAEAKRRIAELEAGPFHKQ
jgi:predicted nucleic acid-binding protein